MKFVGNTGERCLGFRPARREVDKIEILSDASRFHDRTYPDGKHPAASRFSIEDFCEPEGRPCLFAARLPSFSRRRYPVLYLHDGQNVFDAATSFAGVEWGVDETAQRLIRKNLIEPLIIVAVDNTGEERVDEYAPTRGVIDTTAKRKKHSRGLAKNYGRFLIEELKPYIDRKYRTKREPEFTGLGGSSLGGLVTLSLGIWFPACFHAADRHVAVRSGGTIE